MPIFDDDILNWKQFWEQFSVAVHGRKNLLDAEKLVYLQHAIKKGTARGAIEGLSQSGDHYSEAIGCPKSCYDRPRHIYCTLVQKIIDAPSLKDSSGKELRRLHDTVLQHLCALKSMSCEPCGPFITSIVELKIDVETIFEWQKHNQAKTDVPDYQDVLDFIDLRAQASETSLCTPGKKYSRNEFSSTKKPHPQNKTVASNVNPSSTL